MCYGKVQYSSRRYFDSRITKLRILLTFIQNKPKKINQNKLTILLRNLQHADKINTSVLRVYEYMYVVAIYNN